VTIAKIAVALVITFSVGCKKLPDSKLSSLENFTYASGRLRTNECGPPPSVTIPHLDIIKKITIEPSGADASSVRQVLSAVPPGMVQFLLDSRAIIHLDNGAPSKCESLIASGGTISDRAQRSVKYQAMEACALQGMRPGDEIGKGPGGSYYALPPIDIYIRNDPGVIKHELLRQIGGSFFTHYGMLERSVDKTGRAMFLPGGSQRADIALANERLIHAYLRDVANSKFFSMKMLDVYLGPGAGDVLTSQMLDASVTKIPVERRYSTVLRQARMGMSEVEFRAMITTFDTMVALEAFDSYYCNSFGNFNSSDMQKLVLGTYADENEAKSILSRQQNSQRVMLALFPLTFDVFEREMVPAIHRMDRIWHTKQARSGGQSGLALAETPLGGQGQAQPATNEELERARSWLNRGEQSNAEKAARSSALGWVVDDAYESRDRKILLNQAMALRYMQRRYEEVEPQVHRKLDEVSNINDTTFILESALKGRENLNVQERAKLFGSRPNNIQSPFLAGVGERSANPFEQAVKTQPTEVDIRRFGSDPQMAMATMRSLNGDGALNADERRNVQNELVRQMARKEVVWQQIQDIEKPLFDQHNQLMTSVRQGMAESMPEWQANFEKDFTGSVQQKQNMLREKGFGYAAEGLDQRAKESLLTGAPIFDEQAAKSVLDRELGPDSRYNVDKMLADRKSGIPLYLHTEVNMRKLYEDMEFRSKAAYNDPVIGAGEAKKDLRLANVRYVESVSDAVGGTEIPIVAQVGDAVSFGTSAYTAGVTRETADFVKVGTSAVAFVPFGTALKQAGKHADEAGQSIMSSAGVFNKRFVNDVASGGVKAQLAASAVQGSYTLGSMVMSSDEKQPDPQAERLRQEYIASFGEAPKADNAIGIVNQAKVEAEVRQSEDAEMAAVAEQSAQPSTIEATP